MIRAMKHMAKDIADKKVAPEAINEDMFADYLDTKGIPDPDLLIRTSGEQRISNFLLWQSAYTELYFSDKMFPEFSDKDLEKAIIWYSGRTRRFGKTDEQVKDAKE